MSINITLIRATISELYGPTMLFMDPVGGAAGGGGRGSGSSAGRGAGNPPAAGRGAGASNPPAAVGTNTTGLGGTLKAGRANGPIIVYDVDNQDFKYNKDGTNQPLARALAYVIDHQAKKGTVFSRFFFSEKQKEFFFALLRDQAPHIYDEFHLDKHLNLTDKQNWYVKYRKEITDVFRNAK